MKTRRQRALEAEQQSKNQGKDVKRAKQQQQQTQQLEEEEKKRKDRSKNKLKKKRIIEQQKKKMQLDQTQEQEKKIKQNAKNKIQKSIAAQQHQTEKNIKKVIVKGSAPVDQYFYGSNVHVLQQNGKVYSVTLNQTNMKKNSNKFYIIQALESDDKREYYVWTRWGRVGYQGQKAQFGPTTKVSAIRQYESKYYDKHIKGDYRQLAISYGEQTKQEEKNQENVQKQRAKNYKQSQLEKPVKDLIQLIFDLKMMNNQMKQIGYDAQKLPLGKLSEDNIKLGFTFLTKLLEELNRKKPNREQIQSLNQEFYSYIPHDFGFNKMKYYMLDTQKKVKDKLTMLQSLREIKIATNFLGDSNKDANQIDSNYAKLNRNIKHIKTTSTQYQIIQQYIKNTHAATHNTYKLEIVDIFQLHSQIEQKRYLRDIPNKMLLWHGSRLTNYVGILSQGLRIAPPQAPVTGYMFGKGIYFADMVSKSANYCFTNPNNNTGLMLLCQVALGQMNQKYQADAYANLLPQGKLSTKGVGKTFPPESSYVQLHGLKVPLGKPETKTIRCSLQYNQYIVYKVQQVKLKYLIRLKFKYN